MSPPPPGEVHVWSASLEVSAEERAALAASLSVDERRRLDALRLPAARDRFMAARGLLRRLLGSVLGASPGAVEIRRAPGGKPFVDSSLRFNLSHARGMMWIALSSDREVGLDAEFADPSADLGALARRFLSEAERASLAGREASAFYRLWTAKEALLKASGEGMAEGPHRAEVLLPADGPPRLPGREGRWSLDLWTPVPGAFAALAAEGRGWSRVDRGPFPF